MLGNMPNYIRHFAKKIEKTSDITEVGTQKLALAALANFWHIILTLVRAWMALLSASCFLFSSPPPPTYDFFNHLLR
tara:strand:- start:2076 stop:2306 length:231 start_codon:yes stop_codon:yes gene_type:complete